MVECDSRGHEIKTRRVDGWMSVVSRQGEMMIYLSRAEENISI